MNDRRPAGFGGWFVLYALDTEDAASRKMVWTIHHYKVAPIVLVFKGDHWIVVRGFDASAAPTSSADTSYTITAFEVNNPWPPVPSSSVPPPPHSGADNCGTGGNRGVANEHIAYSTWQSMYLTGNKYGTLWNGKNVAVCDPDPPAERPGKIEPPPKRAGGERLLPPDAALEYARVGLQLYGLDQKAAWKHVWRGTEPGRPVLVHRLDQIGSYYYIVPFVSRKETVAAAVAVDARFGDYRQTIALPKGGSSILMALDQQQILELTLGRKLDLEDRLGRITVHREAFCLYPAMVWRPCLESLSPFYPFHMITVGDHRIYVRVDGRVFTKLHTDIPGI